MMSLHHCRVTAKSTTDSHIHKKHIQNVWAYSYAVHAHTAAFCNSDTHTTWLISWGFWVTCGVKMMSLRHNWDWQAPQTAFCIHIGHIQSVWVHSYDVHGHMTVATSSSTHTTCLIKWGSGSLVLGHWWSQNDIMLSWLRLTATLYCFLHPH